MIKVLIVDDSEFILNGLSRLLKMQFDFEVAGMARDGLEAVERASELLPNVVLMDARMPNMDGIEATRRIKQILPKVGILFLSASLEHMEDSFSAGADGYLLKTCELDEMFSEVRRIAAISGGFKNGKDTRVSG